MTLSTLMKLAGLALLAAGCASTTAAERVERGALADTCPMKVKGAKVVAVNVEGGAAIDFTCDPVDVAELRGRTLRMAGLHNDHHEDGMKLIEKAVQLKPDDGYIVDSLGWAHYKQNNFKDAVRYLERAVEIKPEDPTLNDHLGDAFWQVGREREAKFQWNQALSLNPEPDDAAKIKAKVESGLPPKSEVKAAPKEKQAQRSESTRRRSENRTGPQRRVQ